MIRKFIFRMLLLAFLLFVGLAVVGWFYPEKYLLVDSGPVQAEVLIVLGGGSHERPVRAAELYRQGVAPRVIVTGAGDDQINRQLLITNGVPEKAIEVEGKSLTTQENALFTIQRLRAEHVHSAILVTSWYHARRSLKCFEHYAPEIRFYARPSYFGYASEDWTRTGVNKRMRLELLKLPGYWLCHGVNPF